MTEQSNAELIAEVNEKLASHQWTSDWGIEMLAGILAERLEAADQRAAEAERERDRLDEAFDRDLPWRYDEVEAQRNQLAAVVERAQKADRADITWGVYGEYVSHILREAPADALRELKADVWDEGWSAAGAWQIAAPGTPYPWNPYRDEQS